MVNAVNLNSGFPEQAPILIIGGSLVGLATAMFLAKHKVPCLVIEKHRGTAIHPRAGYFQLRTMELMRQAGIEQEVRAAALALYDADGGLNAVETLAGKEIANYIPNINHGIQDVSPARRLFMPQQVLEPILLKRARELGAQFQYSTELLSFEQDSQGVSAVVRNIDTHEEQTIRTPYMVACDGNRSPVRDKLGIQMIGHGLMAQSVTIYFKADCSRALRGRNLGVIYVNNPKVRGFFRLEKTGLGGFLVVFMVGDPNDSMARNVAANITTEIAAQIVRDAVGDPDLAVDVQDVAKWRAICEAADRVQQDRVFIAGDAAHTMTPTGGFGGNTGIQDAHNIAWKLAMVTKGLADASLMDTYNAERQPAGTLAIEQAYNRYVLRCDPDLGSEGMHAAVPDMHVEFNRYRSSAVLPDPRYKDDGRLDIDPRQSRGLPGTRAPHLELKRGEGVISTLDLYGNGFVLMAGPQGRAWIDAARKAAEATGVGLDVHVVDRGASSGELVDLHGDFSTPFWTAYGIGESGASLVRPDGYVAWRQAEHTANAAEKLALALRKVLGHPAAAAVKGRKKKELA